MAEDLQPKLESTKGDGAKFRVKAPQLTLPKGGGAIRSNRGKVRSKSCNWYRVSGGSRFFASPGRAGFGPQISVTYDSGTGNGPFGFRWSVAIKAISRKTDKGFPQYIDGNESGACILAGSEDLVPSLVEAGGGQWSRDVRERNVYGKQYKVHRYRPRVEGLFSRIEAGSVLPTPPTRAAPKQIKRGS